MATSSVGGGTGGSVLPDPGSKWIAYLSPERRVLWTDTHGDVSSLTLTPNGFAGEGAEEWPSLLDAAFATKLPQCGVSTIVVDGRKRELTLKAFPDFSLSGQFKGVIQVLERAGDVPNGAVDREFEVNNILELTLCGVILYAPEQDRILNVNHRAAQQTGYAVADLEGMTGSALWGETEAGMLQEIFKRMIEAGEYMVWGQMLPIRNCAGSPETFFCSLRLIPERPIADSPAAMMISMDAAEMDVATGTVRDGPNPRFVMEAMQDGLWEYDAVERHFFYSPSFAEVFGPQGLSGGPGKPFDEWLESIYPGEPDMVLYNWRRLIKTGRKYRIQYRVRDTFGRWRWIISTIHAVLNDADGRPARVLGFHMDITEAMQSECDLADAEERLRLIFDNAGIGIAVCNTDGTLARVNPAMTLMLGREQSDFTGHWLADFAVPDEGERLEAARVRLLRCGRRESLPDTRFLRPDGREVWANMTATLSRKVSDGGRYVIVLLEDVTAGHAAREKLQYVATHDVLTGAWNRGVLMEHLSQHLGLALRHQQPMSFCLCDLDHFKRVNDTHGHQAGDQVLVRFVEKLREAVRDTDVVGRYGGEEFGVVFPNTAPEGARESMQRALELMRNETFADGEGECFRVTATFGIAGVFPGCTAKDIIARADAALYAGKEAGRSRVVLEGGS